MAEVTGIASVLAQWPDTLARRGVAATMQGESIVFSDFSLGHGCVLLQRATPDSLGGREVILPFEQVAVIKLTESLSTKARKDLGFGIGAPCSGKSCKE
ncbi:MAG: hypothetical protein ACYC6Y_17500 [Thermoguttaceae bacterium]